MRTANEEEEGWVGLTQPRVVGRRERGEWRSDQGGCGRVTTLPFLHYHARTRASDQGGSCKWWWWWRRVRERYVPAQKKGSIFFFGKFPLVPLGGHPRRVELGVEPEGSLPRSKRRFDSFSWRVISSLARLNFGKATAGLILAFFHEQNRWLFLVLGR